MLDAPAIPSVAISPSRDTLAILEPVRYPPIADLARPMLRLAGLRIDPQTGGIHHAFGYARLAIQHLAGGDPMPVALPARAHLTALRYSPDGAYLALANATSSGTDLWIVRTSDATAFRIKKLKLNGIFGPPMFWLPGGKKLVVLAVDRKGSAPVEPRVPAGPIVQETSGTAGAVVTFEDLLASPHDEELFEYYGSSRLTLVDVARGSAKAFGKRAIYTGASVSPNGAYVLAERVHRPFSYLFPFDRFPAYTSVIDFKGREVSLVHDGPLHDAIAVEGVPAGPRAIGWQPNLPASLVWWEALDGGDPRVPIAHRDRVMLADVESDAEPIELARVVNRGQDLTWLADDPRALVSDYDRDTRLTYTTVFDMRAPGTLSLFGAPLRDGDRYNDPGVPLMQMSANGDFVVTHFDDAIYLQGQGYGPQGRRPFLDRVRLAGDGRQRLFESESTPLDGVIAIANPAASQIFLQRQTPLVPPNVVLLDASGTRALTHFIDPTPQLRRIQRRVVNYARPDGVALSFTLYLPPDYREGTRLPALLWAYPAEFNDAAVASQNVNDTQTFAQILGTSEIFMALAGYAVLDNASIPILGDPQTVNDTFVEQLVAGAKAAIDTAVAIGVADPDRIAAGGHSYGAFMTMNLLAHSDLFRAGIARSGAYNRTLTPFGFQNERRTYWEATDTYTRISPFAFAPSITAPVLMIHGARDENSGTFPIQSERMYSAIKGNGGNARLVMLPDEGHGYVARESVETVLAEMVAWLDAHLKDVPSR